MKARAMQIADALEATLPPRFADAAALIEDALAPAEPGDAMTQFEGLEPGLRGWILWPVGEFVARRGLAEPERALLRHASRTLIKAGDAAVLEAWGLGRPFRGEAALSIRPARIALGGAVSLALQLHSTAASEQRLVIGYAVHHVKADGSTSPKVFKGWTLALPARGEAALEKRHAVRPITTRRYFAGRHRVVVQVYGRAVAEAAFELGAP